MDDKAKEIERTMLQRLLSVGQENVAEHLGVNESTISRMKDSDTKMNIANIAKMLDRLDLQVVPKGMRMYRDEDIEQILTLAKKYMDSLHGPEQLAWHEKRQQP